MANRWTTGVDTAGAILERAIHHLSERGPVGIQPNAICEELGISKALVNYYFGGRDGLIGQAMVASYERYVDLLWEAANDAGDRPLERLMAWIDRQVEWTQENAGLAAALNFPFHSFTSQIALTAEVTRRLTEAGTRNFDNLQALVKAVADAARGEAPPIPFAMRSTPRRSDGSPWACPSGTLADTCRPSRSNADISRLPASMSTV